jgi:outer membrane protein assembly factor BamB
VRPGAAAPTVDDEFAEAGKISARWKFQCEDEIRSTPAIYKGMVYVGAYDNNLYAVNAADGAFKWKYPTDGGIVGTPALAPDDNLLIFGSEDHLLHALDIRTGKINWTFKTNGPIRGTVNATLGHAFFGSDDGNLYAVRLSTGRQVWKFEAGAAVRTKPGVTSERIVFGTER